MKTMLCGFCNKVFTYKWQQRPRKFCSHQCYSLYLPKMMRKENHWNWGNGIDKNCIVCNSIFRVIQKRKNTAKFCSAKCYGRWQSVNRRGKNSYTFGLKRSKEQKQLLSRLFSGSNNPRWNGGRKALKEMIRNTEHYKKWRFAIYKRDGFQCVICGATKIYLAADHIKPFAKILDDNNITTVEQARECPELWNIDNGRTLCIDCHKKTPTFGWKITNHKHKEIARALSSLV